MMMLTLIGAENGVVAAPHTQTYSASLALPLVGNFFKDEEAPTHSSILPTSPADRVQPKKKERVAHGQKTNEYKIIEGAFNEGYR